MATLKLILCLAAMPGSGKSELCKNYFEQRKIPKVYMGKPVKDEMTAKGIELTSDNVRAYATRMREKQGYDIVMRLCIPQINECLGKQDTVVIEDIKGQAEIDFLRSYYADSQIKIISIAILASPKTRYERAKARADEWDKKQMASYEDFLKRDRIEARWGLCDAIASADYNIINESSLEELINNFDRLFSGIAKEVEGGVGRAC